MGKSAFEPKKENHDSQFIQNRAALPLTSCPLNKYDVCVCVH